MDVSALLKRIQPCDMNYPFAFVSYSSVDRELVWSDVYELQRRGYNIWIDEANLDKTNDSWKDDALKAIENYHCKLLIFYLSNDSLMSKSCLEELNKTKDGLTLETHFAKVRHIAIETKILGRMDERINLVREYINEKNMNHAQREQCLRTLYHFSHDWFQANNEKIRIHAKDDPNRVSDYYDDIEIILKEYGTRFLPDRLINIIPPERLYREAIDSIINSQAETAVAYLETGVPTHIPSALLLAYLYSGLSNTTIAMDEGKANELFNLVARTVPVFRWKEIAIKYNESRFYSEAVAYILAYGIKCNDSDSLILASKIWLKKGCRQQAMAALILCEKLGSDIAREKLGQLYQFDDAVAYSYRYLDEAPIR